MGDLKPCPFCGAGEEEIDYGEYDGTLRGRKYVMCLSCGAEISLPVDDLGEVFRAWNRRTTEKVEMNLYDSVEIHYNCTVQILYNSVTGEESIGWWEDNDG